MKKFTVLYTAGVSITLLCMFHCACITPFYHGAPEFFTGVSLFAIVVGMLAVIGGRCVPETILGKIKFGIGSMPWTVTAIVTPLLALLVAVHSSCYTVRSDTMVKYEGRLLYPGTRIFLTPFTDKTAPVLLRNTSEFVQVKIDKPEGPCTISAWVNIKYDLEAAKANGATTLADLPDVVGDVREEIAMHPTLTAGRVADTLMSEPRSLHTKVPATWAVHTVQVTME